MSEPEVVAAGTITPRTDEDGRIYTEVRCQGSNKQGQTCNGWLADIYIRDGRIRLRCRRSDCGRITIMVFRPRKRRGKVDPSKQLTTKDDLHE